MKKLFRDYRWGIAIKEKNLGTYYFNFDKRINMTDCFLFNHNEKNYVFFEIQNDKSMKGKIAYSEILEGGKMSNYKICIENDFHMSYPYIFKKDNKIFMIPETRGNNCIALYEAKDFPDKWEKVREIQSNISAVDTSLFEFCQNYYYYTYVREKNKNYLRLYKYCWENNCSRLISSKIDENKNLRPGGRIIVEDKKIYRLSQIYSLFYGQGLRKIECNLEDIENDKTIDCMDRVNLGFKKMISSHNFDINEKYTIYDFYYSIFSPLLPIKKIYYKIRNKRK